MPESSTFLCPLLSLSLLSSHHHYCHHNVVSPKMFSPSGWSYALCCLQFCASTGTSTVIRSADVPSPFPFHICDTLNYVRFVLCWMMMFQILSFSLTLSIFLSFACWLVSNFCTVALIRNHVWHCYVIVGETHWLKTFLLRLGRCLSGKVSLYFPKMHHPVYSYQIFISCSVLHCSCLSQILIVSNPLYMSVLSICI